MCFVSFVGDVFSKQWNPDDWNKKFPQIPHPSIPDPKDFQKKLDDLANPRASQKEVNELKKQMAELTEEVKLMKKMLELAKKYDEKNNEPHCEMEAKVKLLKEVAKLVGVDLRDVFPEPSPAVMFIPGISTTGITVTYDPSLGGYICNTDPINNTNTAKEDPKY